jgi:hypothetical protein
MAGLKLGTTDISAINLGTTKVNKVYKGTNLIADYSTPGGVSPEAQSVLDRMINLSQTETDAIVAFVDKLVAGNAWNILEEFYCFSLNQTDSLTGWRSRTATIQKPGLWTHSVAKGWKTTEAVDLVNGINSNVIPSNIYSGTDILCSAGVWITDNDYTGSGNMDFFGVSNGGLEYYLRSRGSDTNDINIIFMNDSATNPARPSLALSTLNNCLFMAGFTAYSSSYDRFFYRFNSANPDPPNYHLGANFEGIPTLQLFINARNNGGTAQNSRPAAYACWFIFNGDFPGTIYHETLYDAQNFRIDLIDFLGAIGVSGV